MTKKVRGRGSVIKLDRLWKAKMIESIIADYLGRDIQGLKILDIGCGNGDISNYFARQNEQYGVDVKDQRKPENNTFEFYQVDSERLPFDDGFFDVVVSHHVIEHVSDQGLHLDEIWRCLKPNGVAYVATPNKSSPIMEGHVGNDQVLRLKEMVPLFVKHRFVAHEYSCKLLKSPKKFYSEISQASWVPVPILRIFAPLFPSQVFVLRRQSVG